MNSLYKIYSIIYNDFINYRGLKTDDTFYDINEFINKIENGFILIQAHNDAKNINIYLIKYDSDYGKKSVLIEKLVASTSKKGNTDFMIITPYGLPTHPSKKKPELSAKYNLRIYDYHYDLFKLVIPNHILVPKHEIVDEQEKQDLLQFLRVDMDNIKKIRTDDPMIIWLGANENDLIKITRYSDNTGLVDDYRVVVNIVDD